VVGPTDDFNALWVTSKPDQNRAIRGGTTYLSYDDPNSGRLKIESLIPFAQRPFPQANVGDMLLGVTEGPLDYARFGGYVLEATALGEHVDNNLERQIASGHLPSELAVATYNVENLAPTNPQTLQRFVDTIVAAGGPRYEWRQIDPENLTDGGEPGGNIRVGFLFNPARVSFVDRPGGDATTPVEVVGSGDATHLSISPGRIDPENPAFDNSRKPLAGEFVFRDRTVFVVANHFASKGGDQALHGRFQPPNRVSEIQRTQQALAVHRFVETLQGANPRAQLVVLGDINDFQFSPTTAILEGNGELFSLINLLPRNERYSYVFDGNAQVLDQILVSSAVKKPDFQVVHINAEFADQASDHDPSIVRFVPRG
jgi:predicted extracellular nuclease